MNAKVYLEQLSHERGVLSTLGRQIASDIVGAVNKKAELDENQMAVIREMIFMSAPALTHRDLQLAQFVLTTASYINSCQ